MNRLLELQKRMQTITPPPTRNVNSGSTPHLKGSAVNPKYGMRYLPIVGKVTRKESGNGIPLLPVEFEGVYTQDGRRIDTDQIIFESKTNGKGNFFMLLSYMPIVEEQLKNATVCVNVAGQSGMFKMSIMSYAERGKAELSAFLDGDTSEHLFVRLGLQSEKQLTSRNQLTCISLDKLSIA
jgi:hypothetical protein